MPSIRKLTAAAGAVAVFAFGTGSAAAQDMTTFGQARAQAHRAAAGKALTGPSQAAHASIIQGFLRTHGASEATLASLRQTESRTSTGGVTHLRLEQEVAGLTVHGSYVKATLNGRGELVHLIEKLAPASTPKAAAINEAQALAAAMQKVHPAANASFAAGTRSGNTTAFAGGAFFHADPRVTRVAVPMDDGTLAVGYLVETWTQKDNLLHHTLVGGDGRVLSIQKRTASDSYFVFLVDPSKGGQTTVSGPAPVSPAGTTPSPAGWLGSGSQSTVLISGNNVQGYLDTDKNNRPDKGGTAVTNGSFLTAWTPTQSPSIASNKAVAVQNLFYLNNVVHDKLYTKGFTEAAGNFQIDNFGRGGSGTDPVMAEAQDGSGTDNANFSTPPDGRSPRMQMYLWTGAGQTHEVQVNSPVSAHYVAAGAEFGPALDSTGLTGNVVLVSDGVGTTTDACESIVTPLRGLVALVDRGTCTFTQKAQNVQRAGATGMIVANNAPGGGVFTMGGSTHLRIPSVMISFEDGGALRGLASPNATMRKLPVQPLQIDASLDSDVVYHEYGHGLTWRMIGGMSGPLAGAIGEGASDSVAMFINGDDVVGEYSSSNPLGIRRFRYAGYPLGYGDVTGQEVHNDGEIYAAIVWRMIELFGAQRRETLFSYWVDGMNYTPSTPAYEDMRDGLLQAIANSTGSTSDCGLVWQAFAQFGVGQGAQGVVNGSTVTITPSNVNPGNTCSAN